MQVVINITAEPTKLTLEGKPGFDYCATVRGIPGLSGHGDSAYQAFKELVTVLSIELVFTILPD